MKVLSPHKTNLFYGIQMETKSMPASYKRESWTVYFPQHPQLTQGNTQ